MNNLIVIGTSAGGVDALGKVLKNLSQINYTIVVVSHIGRSVDVLIKLYKRHSNLEIKEAKDGESIHKGVVYIAPAMYHLSVESDFTFSLSIEDKVNFSRPSIDVLMNSAAEVYQEKLTGILLTGANTDGAKGMKRIEVLGGYCIVQNPNEAYMKIMPQAALKLLDHPVVMTLNQINDFLKEGEFDERYNN
ncbi:chemotaxis protein CheB [Acidaminobacter sp. JC074]|uniref:chemotaxis protein CheB n=1 Tax=Acidaminobacter sp. JC074 TaxID=2530199 RepID=UPI001F0DE084|nr:chemotaxis protein CheB [Acidaminobacter sp. JC074]MCH4887882.1 chemotaxis protein CheB [Acidaminobacter sp. JC074]